MFLKLQRGYFPSYTAKDKWRNSKSCALTVQIHTTNSCPSITVSNGIVENEVSVRGLKANLLPNPSAFSFVLQVKSHSKDAVEVCVYNSDGNWKATETTLLRIMKLYYSF